MQSVTPLSIESHTNLEPIEGKSESKGLISLRVCPDCQSSLLGAFNHCLSQHSPNSHSIHEIDPFQDALLTSEQPYFDIISDPTQSVKQGDKTEKDRFLFAQQKIDKEKTGILSNQLAKEKIGKTSHAIGSKGFSGALYKRMLDHKDKRIKELQSIIYEQDVTGGAQEKNVDALRRALNKAVKYYTFAEEWQKKESERLEKDVLFLKAELSSMMAFLINEEEEKRKLKVQVDEINKIVKTRDNTIIDMGKTEEQLRLKLHESFKELILINTTMKRLEKEAERGNDAAEKRNEMLQKNLDKLATDFASESQKLSSANIRTRELEFELEETILQFNQVGESKKKSEEFNVILSHDLATTNHELSTLREELENITREKEKFQADLILASQSSVNLKSKLEKQIEELKIELEKTSASRQGLEAVNSALKADVANLRESLKAMTKTKETLDASLKASNEKYKKDIQTRDIKIRENEAEHAEDVKKIRNLTEAREKMRTQVTELQNSLDQEVSNFNVHSFEAAQFKRQAEERILALEDQIEKLTTAKNNLSGEKKQLTERVKSLRSELADLTQELEYTKSAYKTQGDEAIANDIKLKSQIASLETSLQILRDAHRELNHTFSQEQNKSGNLEGDLTQTRQTLAEFVEKDSVNTKNISDLEFKLSEMVQLHNRAVQERLAMKIHLDSVLSKFEELNNTIRNMEQENSASNKIKDAQITRLSNELQQVKDENQQILSLSIQLKALSENLDQDLLNTRISLQSEKKLRGRLESQLDSMTEKFNMERKIRGEFERMNSRIGLLDELRSLERIAALRMRDFKLKEIDSGLSSQLDHLNSIVELLPKELDFGETDSKPIPIFNVKSSSSGNRPLPPSSGRQLRSQSGRKG